MKTTSAFPIHVWSEDDQPREKLDQRGANTLSDAELIAILLRTGSKGHSALDIARSILRQYNHDLSKLALIKPQALTSIHGMGKTKAVTLLAALELGRRRTEAKRNSLPHISSSLEVFKIIQPLLSDLNHEEFYVLLLSQANRVLRAERISQGGLTGTVVDIRLVLRTALTEPLCTSMILAHNHPSGNLKPSANDIELTIKLKQAASYSDLKIIDHLIVGNGNYFSFADEGTL